MTKVIIQIPCFNEADSLPVTLRELPRSLPGVDVVEWLVIDDGSGDATAEVARRHGVHHVVRLPQHKGLARAFTAGITACLEAGADIIVNTDADNQYCAQDIPALIAPVLSGEFEIVVGARPIDSIREFSYTKRLLQKLGSWVIRVASQTRIPDAPSGFRAFSREAALRINVFSSYTYTLETIIQAGQNGISITSVPIRTNPEMRPSRLVKSIPSYVQRSIITILRIFMTYRPLMFFMILGSVPFLAGIAFGVRWIVLGYGRPASHIPSLIASAILILSGLIAWTLGLVADLLSINRRLLENIQLTARRADLAAAAARPSGAPAMKRAGGSRVV